MFGLRLSLTEKDKAALSTLAARAPHVVDASWEEHAGPEGVYLFTDALDQDTALDLVRRGLDVIHLEDAHLEGAHLEGARVEDAGGAAFGDLALAAAAGIPAVSRSPRVRPARGLLEAVRPVRVADSVPAEALFVADVDGGGAQRTLERLLLLDRDDALVGEVGWPTGSAGEGPATTGTDAARPTTEARVVVRVATPPLYLLLRARDEEGEGVRVFARSSAASPLFTAWGTAHPLAALLEDRLREAGRAAVVDEDGRMTLLSPTAAWGLRPILDAVRPNLAARHDVLAPAAGALSFPVRLRLGTAEPADPELWVLSPEQLFKLEDFVSTSPAEEVGRVLVSRVAGVDGRPQYVVREAIRPQLQRLGPRIASLVDAPGFARAPALDNLYLPPARRLVPQLARDQLKALLGLDDAAAVVVDEDGDGLRVISIATLEDAPLSRFTTWIATDRRAELDRLLEDAVASFPGVVIERPVQRTDPAAAVAAEARAPRSPRTPAVAQRTPLVRDTTVDVDTSKDVAAMRARSRVLEAQVLSTSAGDGAAWHELGRLQLALDDTDDACACLEVSTFLGEPGAAAELARALRSLEHGGGLAETSLVELALADPASLTREHTSLLAARVVAGLEAGDDVDEEILHHAQKTFLRDGLLVGGRLQWSVLHAICARSRDSLGATRAKETVLGILNARGLSETLDLPRFVRTSLALMPGDDAAPVDRSRHEQLVHLERLFAKLVPQPLKLTESHDAFLRAIFAVGLGRLGGKAPDVVRALEAELDAHVEAPIRALLRLYIARLSHFLTKGTVEAWKKEVDAVVASLPRPEDRRVVEWLTKRSLWLRASPPEEMPQALRPALERTVQDAERNVDEAPAATARIQEITTLYDYEVAGAVERLLRAALASGRDELIRATTLATVKGLPRIKILAHRVRVLGACVRAAATLEDAELVDQCLDGIAAAARSPNVPSVRDLLSAVKPALAALRRLGAAEAAQRFLSSLEPVALQSDRENGPLLAALSDGFLQLGDVERAQMLVEHALQRALSSSHVERYEAGAAILEALKHWDLEARAQQCETIAANLTRFTDTFTTSRFFATHQLLIAERLVETLVDDVTLRSDRLQAYLDAEEQVIRRRILQQWRLLCQGPTTT